MPQIDLLSPLALGPYTLPNRVLLAPLTRNRAAVPGNIPRELNAEYYRQRATAGLLITEATQVDPQGAGYPHTPGIHSPEQVAGWQKVTTAVHHAGGRIYMQLWHVGRVSHNAYQPGGVLPVSSSAVALPGKATLPDFSSQPYPTPRPLETDEIALVVEQFRRGAENALRAGFDGVELHGANGYLPDQFLRDGVNRRTDRYGGSIQNRARFHLELTRALIDVWGPGRVGVRLSPSGTFNHMRDSNARATFGYLVKELDALGVGYVHIMEAAQSDLAHGKAEIPGYDPIPVSYFRPLFRNVLIVNNGFTLEKANAYLREGWADAVAFGTAFLANPDLPERFRRLAALNTPDPATFYGGDAKGYTDYPFLDGHPSRTRVTSGLA
jgi:N-ethylmaleimide reductase